MNRLLLAAITLLTVQLTAQSQPPVRFRLITKIFVENDAQPAAEHLILFDAGMAYDLPQQHNRFLTVFDPAQERVTLLDRLTQVQTTLDTKDLTKITAQARAAAKTAEQQQQLGLLARVTTDASTGMHEIRYGNFSYQTSVQSPQQPAVAIDYGIFVDLAARLNLVRRQGVPPFGRMTLNDHLTQVKMLPLETTRTIQRGQVLEKMRSTIELSESLSDDDRVRIDEVRGMMALYRDVTLPEFPVEGQ